MGYDVGLVGKLRFPSPEALRAWTRIPLDGRVFDDWPSGFEWEIETALVQQIRSVKDYLDPHTVDEEAEPSGAEASFLELEVGETSVTLWAVRPGGGDLTEEAQKIATMFRLAAKLDAEGELVFLGIEDPEDFAYRGSIGKGTSSFVEVERRDQKALARHPMFVALCERLDAAAEELLGDMTPP
jgi:hypothetical protein